MTGLRQIVSPVQAWAAKFGTAPLGRQAGWIVAPFVVQQLVRLATNVALTRLLAPEMFGLMLLVNTLRTGVELLSDIGIGQSIVRSARGEERGFLDTAWTLQVLRGALLTLAMLAAAMPLSQLYRQPELTPILFAISPIFLITGLLSPSLFLLQRKMNLRARAVYDLGGALFHSVFTIALAAAMPSIWALVFGLILGSAFQTGLSFVVGERVRPRFAWHRDHVREIFGFGKWIFLSTAVYFAAMSTDRFYFVAVLPLALAGVYSVARSFADLSGELAQRAGALLVFPKLAALREGRGEAAAGLRGKRFRILALLAAAVAGGIAVSDQFILLVYDQRYHAAAFMLPVLLTGTWFGVLAAFADAMLMGCGKPAPGARANGLKFAVLLILLPLAVSRGTMFEALLVLVLAEMSRWAALAPARQRERLARVGDDLALTVFMLTLAVAAKVALGWIGVVPTVTEWWALGQIADA